MRLPLVVSIDRIASTPATTSLSFMVTSSIGESMKSTGRCGRVGASGQIWVVMMTSPSSLSPLLCICASLSALATAAIAPSASDTMPIRPGRAPMPPRRPIIPSVGALPPPDLPCVPGISMRTKSVRPLGPVTRVKRASTSGYAAKRSTTCCPSMWALSSNSKTARVCCKLMLYPFISCCCWQTANERSCRGHHRQ